MRQLLLDTHVALWAFGAPERLSPAVRALIIDPMHSTSRSVMPKDRVFLDYGVRVLAAG